MCSATRRPQAEIRGQMPQFPAGHGEPSWPTALLFVALAATAVLVPMFFLGNASGHDFQFHLASWMDVAGQWRQGIAFPRWAEWANWGFGEPRFIFYPPASWMIGAALGSVLPWELAPEIYVWLALIAAGMSMWKLARDWLPGRHAVAAALLFAVNPYNLANVYYRSDFAELLAVAFFPLLLWGALKIANGERRRIPFLAVVFAGIWLSNAPAAVIATYSLVLVLAVACVGRHSLWPLVLGGTAMAAGFCLASFYILPAAWEQRWVQIAQAVAVDLRPERNFIFTQSTDPEFLLFNWKISGVALGMILFTGVAAVISARKRRDFPEIWWPLLTLSAACVFMMFRPSVLVWRYFPELAFVQFPWRWLGLLGVAFAFLIAASIVLLRKRWSRWLAMAMVLGSIGVTGLLIGRDTWWNDDDVSVLVRAIGSGSGYMGMDEYAPVGYDRYALKGAPLDSDDSFAAPPAPRIVEFHSDSAKAAPVPGVKFQVERWSAEHKIFSEQSGSPVTLALRLLNYPAWEVQVDGNSVRALSAPPADRLLVPLAPGSHHVDIRFRRTWDRTVGDLLSVFSAIALGVFCFYCRRKALAECPRT